MKYSVFTVGTPDYNLEDTVKKLKELGYDGVEWRVTKAMTEEPSEIPTRDRWYWSYNKSTVEVDTILQEADNIKELCDKYGIEISALATYLQASQIEKIEEVLKAAQKMGCSKIRVNVPGYNGEINYKELFAKSVEEFKAVEILAKKYNVKVNFEIHHGTIVSSVSAAYRFASNFDSRYIGVIHDAGNMVHEGFEQYKMGLELLGEYLDHVHIKNTKWEIKEVKEDGQHVWEAKWCPLKKGQAKLDILIGALKSIGYDGYLSFEDFSTESTTDEKLKDNIEYIKDLVAKA
jgi:sugar phosphate isomerase/epimerase